MPYITNNKLSILKWHLKNIPIKNLRNTKTDLRYVRSQAFKARIRSSLLSLGIIEPLKVRVLGSELFEILDGNTRKSDLVSLGYDNIVPCLVTECSDAQALTLQCAFAFIRRNLDPIGFARYVKIKHDKGTTLSVIGEPFNLKKAQVSKYLALNKLSKEQKLRVANREISIDDAYDLIRKRRLPFDFKPKPKPCPYCQIYEEYYPLIKISLCSTCEGKLKEVIKRERKHKQKKLLSAPSTKLS